MYCISENEMATPVFLPGESQGQRSLLGCCPWKSKSIWRAVIFKNLPLNSNMSRGDCKIQSPMLTHEESKVSDDSWFGVVSHAPNAFY